MPFARSAIRTAGAPRSPSSSRPSGPLPALLLGLAALLATASAQAVPSYRAAPDAWHQLAYPAATAGRTLGQLFGGALPATGYGRTWQVYTFDARTARYVDPGVDGALVEGQGFWFIQATGGTVDLGGASVPFFTGVPSAACAVPEGCGSSSLNGPDDAVGWNLVGHPFEGPVRSADLRLVTRGSGSSGCAGDGCAIDEPAADVVAGVELWGFDPASGAYADLAMHTLEPWTGFWYRLVPMARQLGPRLLYPDPFCA